MTELIKHDLDAFLVPVCPECHKKLLETYCITMSNYHINTNTGKYDVETNDNPKYNPICINCGEETEEFDVENYEPTTLRTLMNRHPATDYIFCEDCDTWYDHWRNTEEHAPPDCMNTRHPTFEEHIDLVQSCWEDGCVWLDTW